MRAVTMDGFGGPEVLGWGEVPDPEPGPGDVLIEVAAAGVNRADLLQRAGKYPPPPGASQILGLECAGRVVAVGHEVTDWAPGDEVCALLAGGAYAELVAVPAAQVLPRPTAVSLIDAAGLPETSCTVWSTIVGHAGLQSGETLLVHGGTSGIGTFAIQFARSIGVRVFATAGSAEKCARAVSLGAELAVNYRSEDFVSAIDDVTQGDGVDVVLDIVGGGYLDRNLRVLAPDGRLVVIATQNGRRGELDLGLLMSKRASVYSAGLRARPPAQKAAIVAAVREHVWPSVERGAIRVIVEEVLPMDDAARAHRRLETGDHVGKVLLSRPTG